MRVVFRRERDRQVTAVLPEVDACPHNLVCYAHVGQHSECSRGWYQRTRAATPGEYAPLLAELSQIYAPEPLVVRKRLSSRDWQRWAQRDKDRAIFGP